MGDLSVCPFGCSGTGAAAGDEAPAEGPLACGIMLATSLSGRVQAQQAGADHGARADLDAIRKVSALRKASVLNQANEKVARRSALGLRMELLHHLGDATETRHRKERLRLLAAFLNDDALRDRANDGKFNGPGAGAPSPPSPRR